jgi:hypothetical protein
VVPPVNYLAKAVAYELHNGSVTKVIPQATDVTGHH